jgi:hypothetical protein
MAKLVNPASHGIDVPICNPLVHFYSLSSGALYQQIVVAIKLVAVADALLGMVNIVNLHILLAPG